MNVQPDFNTCLILAIEMLKRGVKEIDMHPWGLRLSAPAEGKENYSVGRIPREAEFEYAKSLLRNMEFVETEPAPIAGEEDPNVATEAAGVGPTPENQ